MKNAMKKLTSLLLVAVLLVGALPFAAAATEVTCTLSDDCQMPEGFHTIYCPKIPCGSGMEDGVCDHGGFNHASTCPQACNGQTTCYQYSVGHTDAAYHMAGCLAISKADVPITNEVACTNSYECQHVGNMHIAGCPKIPCANGADCDHGGWDHLETCPYACKNSGSCFARYHLDSCPMGKKTEEPKPTEPKPTEPTTNPGVVDEEWMKDIWLYIYVNNDIIQPAKRILLNNYTIVNDHALSQGEIMTVVDDYYKASNANVGMTFKGAYRETTNITALDFVAGRDETTITGLDVDRSLNTVIIKARVTGVAAISSAVADSSNPKTGDSIYTAMVVMGISAASLAAVMFVYNKKRQTV